MVTVVVGGGWWVVACFCFAAEEGYVCRNSKQFPTGAEDVVAKEWRRDPKVASIYRQLPEAPAPLPRRERR
jgi:hypothetical protein